MNERESLKELINHWIEYLENDDKPSIERFSEWLSQKISSDKDLLEKRLDDELHIKMELGYYLGRIINFTDLWAKLAFKDLPIRQFEDFGVLSEVKRRGNPSKTEVAKVLINEKSTAIERIKRLVNQGLLRERVDKNDKRIRRVALTQKGEKVLTKSFGQAMKVSQLLTWPIPLQEVRILLEQFKKLNRFHTDIYENQNYTEIDDLL